MDTTGKLEQQAIDAAIANNWESAVELNKKIIAQDKENVGAHLRLGFALLQSSQIDQAAKVYRAALRLQPRNQLATENLERIEILSKKANAGNKAEKKNLDPNLFLEIPGKTKTVQLANLGQKIHLAELSIGQQVELKSKKRRIEVRTLSGNYIGALPDDISKRLMFFLEANSEYLTYIKEASLSRILVFIKEVVKGKKVQNYISFPANSANLHNPLHVDSEGDDSADEDDGKEHDDDWSEDSSNDSEEDEEKQDLLHIHTGDDEEESDE